LSPIDRLVGNAAEDHAAAIARKPRSPIRTHLSQHCISRLSASVRDDGMLAAESDDRSAIDGCGIAMPSFEHAAVFSSRHLADIFSTAPMRARHHRIVIALSLTFH